MATSFIGSKEVAIAIITFVLANLEVVTGTTAPLTPDQVYAAGLFIMLILRTFATEGKIETFLPKKKPPVAVP